MMNLSEFQSSPILKICKGVVLVLGQPGDLTCYVPDLGCVAKGSQVVLGST